MGLRRSTAYPSLAASCDRTMKRSIASSRIGSGTEPRFGGALAEAILRSCRNKADVVAADELEAGQRALLNLGHTFGHAIETGMGYGAWLHGEAVAAGMCMAGELSRRMGWLATEDQQRLLALIREARLPATSPGTISADRFLELMAVDKKVLDGGLRLVLLRAIGDAVITGSFDANQLQAMLDEYASA